MLTAGIVIPLFNRHDLTIECLRSLADHSPTVDIVLVDNGSTDETRHLPCRLRNSNNLGFARACNQGALLVDDPVVVFLNNDTRVTPGWLDHLLAPFVEPDVGITGARLLYPSGELAHAGISIDFDRPPGAEARNICVDLGLGTYDVAAVTGACLAIRTELFRSLGGFDDAYWNGYEDVDLCLRVRELGHRIVYTPTSTVVHHESASGPERWTRVRDNVRLLRERWATT